MKEDVIADIWTLIIEHIPEKYRRSLATDVVNVLLDNGIKESELKGLKGVDSDLDDAIDIVIDVDDDPGYDD